MPVEAPIVRDFLDRALGELLSKPENMRGFLGDAVPKLVSGFQFEQMRPAKREYFKGNWRSREADLIYEIPYRLPDQEILALVCVMLEHQTQPDWRTPLKSFFYAAGYWEWEYQLYETREERTESFQLTPILPVVMFTGPRLWGSARSLHELIGEPRAFVPFSPNWSPQFWELASHGSNQLLNAPDAMLQVLAILRAAQEPTTDLEAVFSTLLHQLNPMYESNHTRWEDLIKFLLGWAHNRRPKEERGHWQSLAEQHIQEEERKREIKNMGQTIAQSIFEEGHDSGMRKGIREGKLTDRRQILLRFGRKYLGEPDATTIQTLETVNDLDRLERMLDAVTELKSWADLVGDFLNAKSTWQMRE